MNDEHNSGTTDLTNHCQSSGDLSKGEYGELDYRNGLSYSVKNDDNSHCNPNQRKQHKKPVRSKNVKNKLDTKNVTIRSKKSKKTSMESRHNNEQTSDMSIKSNEDKSDSENQSKDIEEEKTTSPKDCKSDKILKTKPKHPKNQNVSNDENTVEEQITQQLPKYDEYLVESQRKKLKKKIKETLEKYRKFYLIT